MWGLEPERPLVAVFARLAWTRRRRTSEKCRTTSQEKLRPTPTQARDLGGVLWRCRTRYTTALEPRITAWERRRVSVSRYEQEAELKAIRAEYPEYAAIHRHVLHDVLARLDTTDQAFFRARGGREEQAGFPRSQGRSGTRSRSFTSKAFGNGARLDHGALVLSKIGRLGVQWSRPSTGTPKTVTVAKEADGWSVALSCAEVPTHPLEPTDQETGIDLGRASCATRADGTMIHTPRCSRKAER